MLASSFLLKSFILEELLFLLKDEPVKRRENQQEIEDENVTIPKEGEDQQKEIENEDKKDEEF